MKRSSKTLSAFVAITAIALAAICLSGCKQDFSYDTLEDQVHTQAIDASIKYPQFKDKKLSDLNLILQQEKSNWEKQVEEISDWWCESEEFYKDYSDEIVSTGSDENGIFEPYIPPAYYLEQDFSLSSDGNVVTILFELATYTGGAHGNLNYRNIAWDTKKKSLVTLDEYLGLSEDQIHEICLEKLKEYTDWDLLTPASEMKFTVEGDKVFVHFEPYEVASYATGPITIQVK